MTVCSRGKAVLAGVPLVKLGPVALAKTGALPGVVEAGWGADIERAAAVGVGVGVGVTDGAGVEATPP